MKKILTIFNHIADEVLDYKPKKSLWCKIKPGIKEAWVETGKITRCPECGRRLAPLPRYEHFKMGFHKLNRYHYDDVLLGYVLPAHKTKGYKIKKRKNKKIKNHD